MTPWDGDAIVPIKFNSIQALKIGGVCVHCISLVLRVFACKSCMVVRNTGTLVPLLCFAGQLSRRSREWAAGMSLYKLITSVSVS